MPEFGWIDEIEVAESPSRADALAFFGVPPDPADALEENIARKQRAWRVKLHEQRRSATATRKIDAALTLIDTVASVARRPAAAPAQLPDLLLTPPSILVGRLSELNRTLFDLVGSDRLTDALRTAYHAHRYLDSPAATGTAFARLARLASDGGGIGGDQLRRLGTRVAFEARAAGGPAEPLYEVLVVLALALAKPADAASYYEDAQRALGDAGPGAQLSVSAAAAYGLVGRFPEALKAATAAVDREATPAIRLQAARGLVAAASERLLPISNTDDLRTYARVVGVAARLATSEPTAEAVVRPHRLWAAQAGASALDRTARLAPLFTVFLGLTPQPLMGILAEPQWAILKRGPGKASARPEFERLARSPAVRDVHRGIERRFEWSFAAYGAP